MKQGSTTMVVGCIVTLGAMACSMVLVLNDKPTASILSIAGPVIASLMLGGQITSQLGRQDAVLGETATHVKQVQQQTNGVLDQRIRDGVLAALAETDKNAPAGRHAPKVPT